MNFLGNQNHKIATQNWFLTKANLQKSNNKKKLKWFTKTESMIFFITKIGNWP